MHYFFSFIQCYDGRTKMLTDKLKGDIIETAQPLPEEVQVKSRNEWLASCISQAILRGVPQVNARLPLAPSSRCFPLYPPPLCTAHRSAKFSCHTCSFSLSFRSFQWTLRCVQVFVILKKKAFPPLASFPFQLPAPLCSQIYQRSQLYAVLSPHLP